MSTLHRFYWLLMVSRWLYWYNIISFPSICFKALHGNVKGRVISAVCCTENSYNNHFCIAFSLKHYTAIWPKFYSLSPSTFLSLISFSLSVSHSLWISFFLSVRLFWKRCQHCCFYTKRLLLSDGWRQPQLQRRACVCLAAEGRSHWKGQNWEALLVTAMKTLTSTNRIAISNNCAQFIYIRSDLW